MTGGARPTSGSWDLGVYAYGSSAGGKRASTATTAKAVTQGVALTWPSEPGQTYRVTYKTNLKAAGWTELSGPITATGTLTTWTDTSTRSDPQRFYQIVQ
jgi:hypothetical protein